jgi:hypothetical protein
MEEKEIDEWYAREKERITVEYHALVKKGNNKDIEKIRPAFEKKMKSLIRQYNERHEKLNKTEKMRKSLNPPVKKIRKAMDTLSGYFVEKDE